MIVKEVEKANILLESLPYIRKFHNKIVVIKYGGHAMVNKELQKSVIHDIVLLKFVGMNPVIVHGGGPEISQTMKLYNMEPKFIDGLRVTDEATMHITEMVLTGSISPQIAAMFNALDVPSVSVSGKDGMSILAKQRDEKLGLVGEIERIDTTYINTLIAHGYLPIVSPVAIGKNGESYNINSDDVAGKLAGALGAYKLILITDIDGVMRDPKDENSLIHRMTLEDIDRLKEQGVITGGMIPKLDCCINAIQDGVRRCHIINGKIIHSLLLELFTTKGMGTMITP